MEKKKQGSIDWLLKKIWWEYRLIPNDDIIEEAKAMHKEEMRELYLAHVTKVPRLKKIFEKQFEEYYTNTFE